MTAPRWNSISPSSFEWEREALDFLRQNLPDNEPWRAWSNFEFIDDEGRVNEVDALVLTPAGLILIEIKSRPGSVQGDAHSWTWTTDGRRIIVDNPLPLANRKAKRLASLLRRQGSFGGTSSRTPTLWVEPAIFLSAVRQAPRIDPGTTCKVFLRGNPSVPDDGGIIGALRRASDFGLGRAGAVDINTARAIQRAMEQAGIRSASRTRRAGDYELGQIITEGDDWQDFAAKHASTGVTRRVRIYPYARAASPEARDRLTRAAQREFRVLEGVDHPGIVQVRDYRETELGPALIFEYDPSSVRFDRFLAAQLGKLPLETRLAMLRQLAEAIAYAHGKHVYHRGLAPQNILVRGPDTDQPRLQIMNWQVASRAEGSASASPVTVGTRHIEEHFSDPAKAYLAPEALSGEGGEAAGALADVFSLGAIAYHLVAGRPPADSALDLPERLREGGGLRLSDVVDGVGPYLADLVRTSTAPSVRDRIPSASEFLDYLTWAETEQSPPAPTPEMADPSNANPGDRLDGSLVVIKRLGRGGTADALLVKRDGADGELVLKVAVDAAHGDRIRAEAEVLRRLHHQNIVRFEAETEVRDRPGILMERAGEKTLAQWLRGKDPLSLDLMRRFGEHLLEAVGYLEEQGVVHRDIKPDNIGVAKAGGSGAYRLVLFDFSLARTPPENLEAGTRPYLDPFLGARRPPRWDLHAERYAAAVTLHEMLTGATPSFGDGLTDPLVTDDEATIAFDRFDPVLRDGLTMFFSRALRRDPAERFGNAEEMLRAWRQAFEPMDRAAMPADSIELISRRLTRRSSIAEVGYGVEARDVLDRMGIHTVQQLLDVPRLKFRYLTGVGDRIRKEIRERAKRLAQLRPDLIPGGATNDGQGWASLDRLGEQLLPRRPAGDERPEDRILAAYLGLEPADAPSPWPSAGDVARAAGVARSAIADTLEAARERWHKSADLNALRTELAGLLTAAAGVATADELAAQILTARGSVEEDEAERIRLARAVVRAAVELEASVLPIRFAAYADGPQVLIASRPELAAYANNLGGAADRLAAQDPLPSPPMVGEALATITPQSDILPLPQDRVLRLAAAASAKAALSARTELYPRGLAPELALRLSLGALAGPRMLTEAAIRERVRGRFPEAAPLPPRPALDALLEKEGAERVWREDQAEGPGYYARTASGSDTGSLTLVRHPTVAAPPETTPDVLDARALEEKIAHAARTGAFLALTVDPRRAREAEAELVRRFPRVPISLERLMLEAMRAEAAARRVQWPKVLAADAMGPESRDFQNLLRLASRAVPRVREQVLSLREPALLIRPGLLARYDLMPLLDAFAQASGTASGPPSLFLLVPQDTPGLPRIDGAVLPVISSANWARLTEPWLANAHRAGAAYRRELPNKKSMTGGV